MGMMIAKLKLLQQYIYRIFFQNYFNYFVKAVEAFFNQILASR